MLKRIGLSAAAIFAAVALAQPPAAMAAARDDFRGRNNYQSVDRDDHRNVRDFREDRAYQDRLERERQQRRLPAWREPQWNLYGDRDHDGDRR
jgi:hypothetical protein